MAEQSEKSANTNAVSSNEITVKKKTWDTKSHEEGINILAKHLFGINEKETEDGFPDIEFTDNFENGEIKTFMKVLKKLVEFGESTKIRNQNLVNDGVIVNSEEKTISLNAGLTHLNKYIYPVFWKRYSDWITRKKTEERINMILAENKKLKEGNKYKKRKTGENDNNSSDESDTKSSESDNGTNHKPKKKCTKNIKN